MYHYDMSTHQRETFTEQVKMVDSDGKAINLTGKKARGQVRKAPNHSELLATMTCTVTPAQGTILFGLSSTQTENIPIGKWAYDVCIEETVDAVTVRKYIIGGDFIVKPSVTQ